MVSLLFEVGGFDSDSGGFSLWVFSDSWFLPLEKRFETVRCVLEVRAVFLQMGCCKPMDEMEIVIWILG